MTESTGSNQEADSETLGPHTSLDDLLRVGLVSKNSIRGLAGEAMKGVGIEHELVAGDDEASDTQGCSPGAHDDAVLVAISPVSDLLLEGHSLPCTFLFKLFAVEQAETFALPVNVLQ
jgi:hypothetical protein